MYEEKEIKYKKRKIKRTKHKNNKQKTQFFSKPKIKISKPDFFQKIDLKVLLIRLLVLLVIMITIIFIISRLNKNFKERNVIINSNINEIKIAALKFYNKNNLPQNIGDSTSLILDEMVDKNLINKLTDKKDKTCNFLNSYVIVTKTDIDNYRLKIYLTCPSEEKLTEFELICHDSCETKK